MTSLSSSIETLFALTTIASQLLLTQQELEVVSKELSPNLAAPKLQPSPPFTNVAQMPTITLPQGTYTGATTTSDNKGKINYYHNIPYAQPFSRFQPPQPIQPVSNPDNVIDATHFGPICPQNPSRLESYIYGPWPTPPNGGEADERGCGVLSVYQPENGGGERELLPVIVYAHGGAWQTGSSQINWYTGTALARDGECVVVTINYRCGVLGFLHQPSNPTTTNSNTTDELALGNQDHILALEWVRVNVQAFGGDPENVTAAGQSAGAYNTQLLFDVRPDLFRRAIIMSSPADMTFSPEDAGKVTETVKASLPEGKTLESATVEELLVAQAAATKAHGGPAQFAPVARDGGGPIGTRREMAKGEGKDVLVTWTQHDGSAFAALSQGPSTTSKDELSVKLTNALFKEPSIRLAERLNKAGHRVVTLEHQWSPEGYKLGATHCVDLPLVLGDFGAWSKAPIHGTSTEEEWDRRGKVIREAFGRFARDGTVPGTVEGTSIEKLRRCGSMFLAEA
ncbi:hypothetical protein LTR56_006265 [Elasticomyces elasticus]|nr:hypothetical protein LTR56_006265 [Elasticomyces elasticus]KAK3666526.1 hypothetical protein LTR22_002470 [Elasticomyces elasticus]KAK4928341.1 hypothetical protein LTR49_005018 [Elasticomyces elasticus]KAK5763904.1 hypothetical protein LTS12_006022 [Elasticomyces elasticus]